MFRLISPFNKNVSKVQGQDFAKGQGRAAGDLPRM
jgi:hypothetical protein